MQYLKDVMNLSLILQLKPKSLGKRGILYKVYIRELNRVPSISCLSYIQ